MAVLKVDKNVCKLPVAIFFLVLGISSLIYTPTEFLFDLRLRMLPGTPPFEYWRNPPENSLMNVYIFNITNPEQFLNGTDHDLHLQEIGPIVFREKLTHTNIVYNENSTMTYTTTRVPEYLPEKNTIDMNATIMVPNLSVLTMASYFHDSSYLVKTSIRMLLTRYNSPVIINTTIYNYLFNLTDPLMDAAKIIGGGKLVPSTNVGCLAQMYLKNKHTVTVFIGPKYGHSEFFNINNYDGEEWITGFKECKPRFINTSETMLFPQFLEKSKVIWGWKNMLCKLVEGRYTNETSIYGMTAYRYDIPLTSFHRTEPLDKDCYKGDPVLPNGVADISPCYNGLPLVASFAHFTNADPIVTNRLKGLNPQVEKHSSFLILEKSTGVPIDGRAIFQVSLHTHNLDSFNEQIRRFSNMYLPMAYVGYEFEDFPWHVYTLLYFMAVIIPNSQLIMSLAFLATGGLLSYYLYLDFRIKADKKVILAKNIELEKFLK